MKTIRCIKHTLTAVILAAVCAAALAGCGLLGNNKDVEALQERQAELEAQIALLLAQSTDSQVGRIAELEALIGELRSDLADAGVDTTADVIETVVDSAVAIFVRMTEGEFIGSGFFIAHGGYIATNSHVITSDSGSVSAIQVYLNDGTSYAVNPSSGIVANIAELDIAILKATAIPAAKVKPVTIDTTVPRAGSRAIAIGTPAELALMFTSTAGIVSATDRTEFTYNEKTRKYTVHEFCLQMDAIINPGNSGGPLFNMAGHVIGINTMGMTDYQAIGFAIEPSPVKYIQAGIEQSILGGYTYRLPTLNIETTDAILDAATALGTGQFTGAGVKVVSSGNSTLRTGVIITKIDGVTIGTRQAYYKQILSKKSGDPVSVTYETNVFLGTETRTATLTV